MDRDELHVLITDLRQAREAELKTELDRSLPLPMACASGGSARPGLALATRPRCTTRPPSSAMFARARIAGWDHGPCWTALTEHSTSAPSVRFLPAVHIYTHANVAWAVTGAKAPRRVGAVAIADRVYVGSQSVKPGVSVGMQSVIGANSLVNRDIPANTIYAGTPARQIGRVVCDGNEVEFVCN